MEMYCLVMNVATSLFIKDRSAFCLHPARSGPRSGEASIWYVNAAASDADLPERLVRVFSCGSLETLSQTWRISAGCACCVMHSPCRQPMHIAEDDNLQRRDTCGAEFLKVTVCASSVIYSSGRCTSQGHRVALHLSKSRTDCKKNNARPRPGSGTTA